MGSMSLYRYFGTLRTHINHAVSSPGSALDLATKVAQNSHSIPYSSSVQRKFLKKGGDR